MPDWSCNNNTERFVYLILSLSMETLMLTSIIVFIYKLITNYIQTTNIKDKPPKLLFCIGIIFFLTSFTTNFSTITSQTFHCTHGRKSLQYSVFNYMYHQLYVIQFLLLQVLLLLRLYFVFKDTTMALSKLTIYFFSISFITLTSCGLFVAILEIYESDWYLRIIFLAITYLLAFMLMIVLVILFIIKILSVYKDIDSDEQLILLITKITCLTFVSILVTIIAAVMIILDPGRTFGDVLSAQIDVYTNFLCIALSYKQFDGLYMKVCGCCHKGCERVCYRFAMVTHDERETAREIGSVEISAGSVSDANVSV